MCEVLASVQAETATLLSITAHRAPQIATIEALHTAVIVSCVQCNVQFTRRQLKRQVETTRSDAGAARHPGRRKGFGRRTALRAALR